MVCFAFIVVIVCVLGRMEKIEIWKSEWEGACCYIWQDILRPTPRYSRSSLDAVGSGAILTSGMSLNEYLEKIMPP
jgi:hypothetical protein